MTGRRVYHFSYSCEVYPKGVNNGHIHLRSGRLRSIYADSDRSSVDKYMGPRSDEELEKYFCDCAN